VKDGHVTRADLSSSARGLAGLQIVQGESGAVGAEDTKVALVDCPAGKFAVGGGGAGSSPVSLALTESYPAVFKDDTLPRGWVVAVSETASITTPWRIHAYVLAPGWADRTRLSGAQPAERRATAASTRSSVAVSATRTWWAPAAP
jgi:hypothetical protein